MQNRLVFMSLFALLSCGGSGSGDRDIAESRTVTPDEDFYCKGDTTVNHNDPGRLVREYLARDGVGEFLSTSKFWLSATECAGEGTDVAAVIASYSVDSVGIRADTARFVVTYRFLGDLVQGSHGFEPRARVESDTFMVIRRSYGWRIVGQHDLPILLPDAAKAHWPLTRDDLSRLDSLTRKGASGRGA